MLVFLLSVFLFTEFIYKPLYEVELKIGTERFLFETKDTELYEDFKMLKFFYEEEYNNECY